MATEIKALKSRGRFRTSVKAFEGFLSTLVFALKIMWPFFSLFLGLIFHDQLKYSLKNLDRILVFKFHSLISIMKLFITRVFN